MKLKVKLKLKVGGKLHLVSPGGGLPGGLLETSNGVVETWLSKIVRKS